MALVSAQATARRPALGALLIGFVWLCSPRRIPVSGLKMAELGLFGADDDKADGWGDPFDRAALRSGWLRQLGLFGANEYTAPARTGPAERSP